MKKVSLLLTAVMLSAAVAFAGDNGKKDKKSDKKEACTKGESSCCASKKSAKADEAKGEVIASKENLIKISQADGSKVETVKTDKKLVLSK